MAIRLTRAFVMREMDERNPETSLNYIGPAYGLLGTDDPVMHEGFEEDELIVGIREDGTGHLHVLKLQTLRLLLGRWRHHGTPPRNPITNVDLFNASGNATSEIGLYSISALKKRKRVRSASTTRMNASNLVVIEGGRKRRSRKNYIY